MPKHLENYNGWVNRETWAAALWIDNDEGLYKMFKEALAAIKNGDENEDNVAYELARQMRDFFSDLAADLVDTPNDLGKEARTMLSDIGSLDRVDWEDVAKAFAEGESHDAA